jgi:NADPH-dependent ferric siderophore reductase
MAFSPDASSLQLAERLQANALVCEVAGATPISPSLHELIVRGHAAQLAGEPGNDVMLRLEMGDGTFVRRRYSVRSLDESRDEFTLWLTTEHVGPGSDWVQRVAPGELVDVIGPRGKIPLEPAADWHLFVGDVSGLGAFYRMAQSIEAPGRAIFIVEIDHDEDAVTALFDEGVAVTGIFVNRQDRARNDPAGLLSGLAAFALPPDQGHAYLFGEFSVVRVVRNALVDRGLPENAISLKAFWRMGRANAEHGEPDKSDD